jgi:cytochrome c peroxidase
MNLNIKGFVIFLSLLSFSTSAQAQKFYSSILKNKAWDSGYLLPEKTHVETHAGLVRVGKHLFESKKLSLNGNIACVTCHIDQHGSSDGLPNAVGIGGKGSSKDRLLSGGRIVPRNSLSLFGVGGKGFQAFFWDGRVKITADGIQSPFGSSAPSPDPLIVAVHLPVAEIRETLQEDAFIQANKKETVRAAEIVYEAILNNLKQTEPEIIVSLAKASNKSDKDLQFKDVATAIAHFIRHKFRLQESKFSRFMRGDGKLHKKELLGGIIFYGKGGCVGCHKGAYFTDFDFHTVAYPQAGFGKNGFGVDYGRYNVTFNPDDIYKFRTPSLHNIFRTKPFGHSGSIFTIFDAVQAHYDPLAFFDTKGSTTAERFEFLKYLKKDDAVESADALTKNELEEIVAFLKTLEFLEGE